MNLIGPFGNLKVLLIGGMSSDMVKDILVIDPDTYAYTTLKSLED